MACGRKAPRCQSRPCVPRSEPPPLPSRRRLLLAPTVGVQLSSLLWASPSQASKLGFGVDKAWESLGGGPPDLTFPDFFEGLWTAQSTLVNVEFPMGKDAVPNLASVERAQSQELGKPMQFDFAFTRNASNYVILDRRFNIASMFSMYYPKEQLLDGVVWNPEDPNELKMKLPTGGTVDVRVTRRSQNRPESNRMETSEFFRQVLPTADMSSRVKASQCFTKYKWRSSADDGGPLIVATQVISDYVTTLDDSSTSNNMLLSAQGRPVDVLTYRVAFWRR